MNRRFSSRHLVWLLIILALMFTLAACERPLNEKEDAVTGTSNEGTAGELSPDGELPETEPAGVIVPPTPETVQPDGEGVGTDDDSEGTVTDISVEESDLATEDGTTEDSTQPESETPVEEAVPDVVHVVQVGDNLYRIGLQYGCTIEELAIYNEMANPDYIDVGDEIRIPPDCEG